MRIRGKTADPRNDFSDLATIHYAADSFISRHNEECIILSETELEPILNKYE